MNKNHLISKITVQNSFYNLILLMAIILLCTPLNPVYGQENRYKGQRPYELDWAGRYEDDHLPLIDFEKE